MTYCVNLKLKDLEYNLSKIKKVILLNQKKALEKTVSFWKNFYKNSNPKDTNPTPFALWCLEHYITKDDSIFEIGCGDGRDSFAFINNKNQFFGIDGCNIAIEKNKLYLKNLSFSQNYFETVDFNKIESLNNIENFNIFYSRFVLHAIPEVLEDKILRFIHKNLPVGGKMLHEFRTNHDRLMQKGESLSENERLTDHYRRFINAQKMRKKLIKIGFNELYFIESDDLAIYGEENPVVARIVSEKK